MRSSELLDAARSARGNAYAPYSKFAVGAAVDVGERIVTGCNVENASYGLSICAERVALCNALAQGHRTFSGIAIAGPEASHTAPCGACRQFMVEFSGDMPVTFTSRGGTVETTLQRLLPDSFRP